MADCGVCLYCLGKKYARDKVERRNVVKKGNMSQSTSQSLLMNLKKKLIQVITFRETII